MISTAPSTQSIVRMTRRYIRRMEGGRDPVADLKEIAFRLETANEATYRVRAFRSAAAAAAKLDPGELRRRAADGTLTKVPGIGDVTARCVVESLAGEEPV